MITCEFCGLDAVASVATYVYDIQVCFDCVDLAEIAYEGDEAANYLNNIEFDVYHDR